MRLHALAPAASLLIGCAAATVPDDPAGDAGTRSPAVTDTAAAGDSAMARDGVPQPGGAEAGATGGAADGGGGSTGTHCTNGKQDGDESGVDCGGALCPACTADYKINPPNACQNQFYYEGCTSGNTSTKCGGVCQPRNACENAPGKDGKVGFACSRYMLFAPMMLQAAQDDARANAWPTPADPPFFYAVAGHDTNSAGIDKGMIGGQPCCECYQLVFDKPYNEYNYHTPAPKPLLVQVFNIGATTDSFDIYMGAGGLGAFNACYSGASSSTAGFALYDKYPTDGQPNDGGVKFLRHNECKDQSAHGEATPASISSGACQGKIAELCGQIEASKSAGLATVTRDSCVQGNRLETLYHQNWAIYARRVGCPDNLTRVTGCKLAPEPGLPAPDPKIATAAQAQAAGFLGTYHTTTMQDCCKPACAWTEKVGGREARKNADPVWASFYTCDASDRPMTE